MVKNRSAVAGIIGLFVLVLVYCTVPSTVYKPQGLFLPSLTYHAYPPKKETDVQWLLYPPAWVTYPQLGYVSFEFHDPIGSAEKREQIMDEMKKAAAAMGGNAVVKQQLFSTAGYVDASQAIWVGRGVVILVPKAS
jgi:hypothetical protein